MTVEGIILAAGLSSRAGAYKLTLDLYGKTVIERCIEGMYDVCSSIVVVGGYNIGALEPVAGRYAKTKLIYNRVYESGMFSSVLEGFKLAGGDKLFIIPGDCPLVCREVYENLLRTDESIVIPAYKGQKGHPVLLDGRAREALLTAPNFASLRQFTESYGYIVREVNCPGILMDIDTPEDLTAARRYLEHRPC